MPRLLGRSVHRGLLILTTMGIPSGLFSQEPMPETANPASGETDAAAVCISNPTDVEIRYRHRWSFEEEWGGVEALEAGRERWYWWRFEPDEEPVSPDFFIIFDDHFDRGYTARSYVLDRYPVSLPGSCDAARKYWFAIEGRAIRLYSVN